MTTSPTVPLNNGIAIPQLGFGVFQVPDEQTEAVVSEALGAGYRSIDTAAIYGNERGVGRAIARSGIPREDLFITTKLWNSEHGRQSTRAALERSLDLLGLDHIDLYLIHWPAPAQDRYVEAWEALEELYAEGRARAIGVSNFEVDHLERILALGGTVPAVNQIELHPALPQRQLQAYGAHHRIATEAWSPLAQGALLEDPVITRIAARLGRTPAQVVLQWHVQQGRVAIPKSVTPERIRANLDVFGFELPEADMSAIDALEVVDGSGRTGPHPASFNG